MNDKNWFDDFFEKNYKSNEKDREYAEKIFKELSNIITEEGSIIIDDLELVSEDEFNKKMNFETKSKENILRLKKSLNLSVKDISIFIEKKLMVLVHYSNDEGTYYMEERYPLTPDADEEEFGFRDEEYSVKKKIVKKLLNSNYYTSEYNCLLDFLKKKDVDKILNNQMQKAIDMEAYEEAVIYRELIKEKRGL